MIKLYPSSNEPTRVCQVQLPIQHSTKSPSNSAKIVWNNFIYRQAPPWTTITQSQLVQATNFRSQVEINTLTGKSKPAPKHYKATVTEKIHTCSN